MATISENLQTIKDSTVNIKNAIINKGGAVTGDMTTYAQAIDDLDLSQSTQISTSGILKVDGILGGAPLNDFYTDNVEGIYYMTDSNIFAAKSSDDLYYLRWENANDYNNVVNNTEQAREGKIYELNKDYYTIINGTVRRLSETTLAKNITNDLGTSERVVVSQKTVTENLNNLNLLSQEVAAQLNSLGYTYIGTATPSTTPVTITEDDKVFYIATEEGDYSNFGLGNISELSVIKSNNGNWKAEGLGVDLLSRAAIENHKNIENSRWFSNVFKTEGIIANTFLNLNNGTTYDRNGYSTSDYIPVLPNKEYVFFRQSVSVVFYDINLRYVSYKNMPESGSAVVPDNAYYARISYYTSWGAPDDIYVGLPPKNLNRQIGTDKIADKAITAEKTSFFTYSKNLCNSESPDFILGKYLGPSGQMVGSTSAFITPYIRFTQDMGKLIVSAKGAMIAGGYYHCLYGNNFNFIKGVSANDGAVSWEEGVAYVRFSGGSSGENVQVEIGDKVTPYEPYSIKIEKEYLPEQEYQSELDLTKLNPVISSVGQNGMAIETPVLQAATRLKIDNYPSYLKKTGTVVGYCTFEGGFTGDIYVGFNGGVKGDTSAGSGFFARVTPTDVIVEHKYANDGWGRTKPHGLTLNKYVCLAYSRDNKGVVHVILSTLGGQYVYNFTSIPALDAAGVPFIESTSMNVNDVKLSVYNSDFKKPIWVLGDSYVYLANDTKRWTYVMQEEYNISNFLLQGVSGGTSSQMFNDLKKSLEMGTPKFLVWCLGMNDSSLEIWRQTYDTLSQLCEDNGIELILTTIPTTPAKDKETISQYIRDSGRRYIDIYKAVGTSSSGEWLDGCLATDNVHPTQKGSKVIAARVLVDFPEIIDFNA